MSSEIAIRARGLGKIYRIYSRPHHRLAHTLFPHQTGRWAREFHALSGVDLTIHRGETVGIVGRNGSGKSTLLQIICGTLTPTAGELEVNGRIAALLELGAGFNPEFTGRENVFLNGAVMGLERREVQDRFDAIAAFADIGEFIEQPVKTYSSGMYIRLAFAVAISSDPSILVVDEALSVGDEAFQRKCFARIEEIKRDGCTILFVSHSAATVVDLCDRAVLIDKGELLLEGEPKEVVGKYQKLMFAPPDRAPTVREELRTAGTGSHKEINTSRSNLDHGPDAYYEQGLIPQSTFEYVERGAKLHDPHLRTLRGDRVNVLVPGDEYIYTYEAEFTRYLEGVRCGMMIRTLTGIELAGAATTQMDGPLAVSAGERFTVSICFRCMLAPGTYFLNAGIVALVDGAEEFVARRIDAAMFKVMTVGRRVATGIVDLQFRPCLERPA